MKKLPVIGLTGVYSPEFCPSGAFRTTGDYIRSVRLAGGTPVILPQTEDPELIAASADVIDGLLLPGGGDVLPSLYGEDAAAGASVFCGETDLFEFGLLRRCVAAGKPVFGICRGLQVINVAFGGTLWQDIPTELPTKQNHYAHGGARDEPIHRVTFAEGSLLRRIFGESALTNSFHHQAVKDLAPGFEITARTADGVTEGIECAEKNVFAVQFHPENFTARRPEFVGLFRELVLRAEKA